MNRRPIHRMLFSSLLGLALLAGGGQGASAVGIGTTQVIVTSFEVLTGSPPDGLGLDVTPIADAVVFQPPGQPSPSVFFPVTGVGSGGVEHQDSGLSLSASTSFLDLENFVVDLVGGTVSGDVTGSDGTDAFAVIFDVTAICSPTAPCVGADGTLTPQGFELSLSDTAGSVIESVFGVAGLAGTVIGVASTNFIPEPSTALLLCLGLAGLARAGRR